MRSSATIDRLERLIAARRQALDAFVAVEGERIAHACHEMARRFARGGTLIPYGTGAAATDAAHAAVEFMHPVIVGKRALPAIAPTNDPSRASRPMRLAGPDDIALGLAHVAPSTEVDRFLADARRLGALTIALRPESARTRRRTTGEAGQRAERDLEEPRPHGGELDFDFAVPGEDAATVQEVEETTYHVLWELVHVFFEHPGLLEDACLTCGDVAVEANVVEVRNGSAVIERDGAREEVAAELVDGIAVGDRVLCHAGVALERLPTRAAGGSAAEEPPEGEPRRAGDDPSGFLYPFLGREETNVDAVLADVRASTARKAGDVIELRAAIDLDAVDVCAAALRERLDRGGRVLAFGNGGSSTDAQDLATDLLERGWPALALTNDVATVTAVGNDVGFDKVFARQLIPLASPRDTAFAITTSGNSANVLAGLAEARKRGLLTCALAGYDGGKLAELEWLDHLFIVRSDYIPRIQEAQATVYHLLCEAIGSRS